MILNILRAGPGHVFYAFCILSPLSTQCQEEDLHPINTHFLRAWLEMARRLSSKWKRWKNQFLLCSVFFSSKGIFLQWQFAVGDVKKKKKEGEKDKEVKLILLL